MNDGPTTPEEQVAPEPRVALARWAARVSPFAPLFAWVFNTLLPEPQTRMGKLVTGSTSILVVVAGFVLALVALRVARKHGGKDFGRFARVGVAVNGVVLLVSVIAMAALYPAIQRVARMRNAGYTRAQMEAMPEVIPGSRKILDETLGFRIEIPQEFIDAPEAPMANTIYSFVRPAMLEPGLVIMIRRLGAHLPGPTPAPDLDMLRSDFPAGSELKLSASAWKTYSLDVVTVHMPAENTPMCLHFAVVPLCREAVQVIVAGPATREPDSRKLLSTLLTSLRGLAYADSVDLVRQEKAAHKS